jgi:hypothetical protein
VDFVRQGVRDHGFGVPGEGIGLSLCTMTAVQEDTPFDCARLLPQL